MTASWALDMAGHTDDLPLQEVAAEIGYRFSEGAATADEVDELADLRDALQRGVPMIALEPTLRAISHAGYLRGAIVVMATVVERTLRPDVALSVARELMDAVDPDLGVRLARAVLALPEVDDHRHQPGSTFVTANRLLGESLLERDDPAQALRHFEAVLAIDVDDPRALRGWSAATRSLERRGVVMEHRSRGLALLDGLDELELSEGFGIERYELTRPLGRGRHAVVYEAYDRRVGRDVAIKRLLEPEAQRTGVAPRVLEARFFAEAKTLARVRSPYVIALLDTQPKQRFIALELCRGGSLRLALRRGLVGPADLDRIGSQLGQALEAVHAAAAVHRDVKPANILVRHARRGSAVALADFGLAVGRDPERSAGRAGTLRYLAPELRGGRAKATAASDRFSAGVVLLELARAPAGLPEAFDRMDVELDAASFIPDTLEPPWADTLKRLLDPDPEARTW